MSERSSIGSRRGIQEKQEGRLGTTSQSPMWLLTRFPAGRLPTASAVFQCQTLADNSLSAGTLIALLGHGLYNACLMDN